MGAPSPDPFEILGLSSRPWLEETAVRRAFQGRARALHPDSAGGDADRFAVLNAACAALANPASRLRLLAGDEVPPAMPSDMQTGFRVAELAGKTRALVGKAGSVSNPLAKALLAAEATALRKDLAAVEQVLADLDELLESCLREVDARWPEVPAREIAALAGEYVFLGKWRGQVRDATLEFELAFGKSAATERRPPAD
jgi:curved DNA-binding protein CbpA